RGYAHGHHRRGHSRVRGTGAGPVRVRSRLRLPVGRRGAVDAGPDAAPRRPQCDAAAEWRHGDHRHPPRRLAMRHEYHLADVFTDRIFGGNPLAVFPRGDLVAESIMPRIAGELNLSETVFVLPPQDPEHAVRLRIFTPGMELPFAGHPTVGAACVLAELGRIPEGVELVFEEAAGPVSVRVQR